MENNKNLVLRLVFLGFGIDRLTYIKPIHILQPPIQGENYQIDR